MVDGLVRQVLFLVPGSHPTIELVGESRVTLLQFVLQHLGEQVVIAVVTAVVAERHHEQSLPGEPGEELTGFAALPDQSAQAGRKLEQHRGAQQKLLHVRRLSGEDLGRQVLGDLAAAAADVAEPLSRGTARPGEAGELQAGGPPLGRREQSAGSLLIGHAAVQAQQLRHLGPIQHEKRGTDLGDLAAGAHARQRERGVGARSIASCA